MDKKIWLATIVLAILLFVPFLSLWNMNKGIVFYSSGIIVFAVLFGLYYVFKFLQRKKQGLDRPKLPYWLRGGIIGVIISIIIFGMALTRAPMVKPFFNPLFNFLTRFDFLGYFFCGGICTGWDGLVHMLTLYPSLILIGVVIGYIIGVIKNRKLRP